ncbi:hypothetical protein ACFC34_30910 [Streptomyces sp. NPDC056053]|uniref:hypothetical protein n=1 Tax=Streptomyces sp. NPDC056053 TaxID=3345696 RepID=UPI0035E342BD
MRHKRFFALLAVPLGASFALLPSGSAQAADASPSVLPSQFRQVTAGFPNNRLTGSGFAGFGPVHIIEGGRGFADTNAGAGGSFSISGTFTAPSYIAQDVATGKSAVCDNPLSTTPPKPNPDPESTGKTPFRTGFDAGFEEGEDACPAGRRARQQQGLTAADQDFLNGFSTGVQSATTLFCGPAGQGGGGAR